MTCLQKFTLGNSRTTCWSHDVPTCSYLYMKPYVQYFCIHASYHLKHRTCKDINYILSAYFYFRASKEKSLELQQKKKSWVWKL